MSAGAWVMVVALVLGFGGLLFVIMAMIRSVRNERSAHRSIWREFSLGLGLMILFFVTWIAHGIAEWQVFTDEQQNHGESAQVGDFIAQFAQSTLENWQSEYLQLFAFVSLAALYIHKGSAESKDGEEKIEASLRRIEEHLGILPASAPSRSWHLPETPLEAKDRTQ